MEAAKGNLADNNNNQTVPIRPTLEQGVAGNEGVPTAESTTALEAVPTAESLVPSLKTDQFQLPESSFAKIIENSQRTNISIWQIYGANLSGKVASNLTSKGTQLTYFSTTKR